MLVGLSFFVGPRKLFTNHSHPCISNNDVSTLNNAHIYNDLFQYFFTNIPYAIARIISLVHWPTISINIYRSSPLGLGCGFNSTLIYKETFF